MLLVNFVSFKYSCGEFGLNPNFFILKGCSNLIFQFSGFSNYNSINSINLHTPVVSMSVLPTE